MCVLVIPAQAGIQGRILQESQEAKSLDPRLRGDDDSGRPRVLPDVD